VSSLIEKETNEHRTSNIERPILMALRFVYFKTSEPQNVECRMLKDGIASLTLFF